VESGTLAAFLLSLEIFILHWKLGRATISTGKCGSRFRKVGERGEDIESKKWKIEGGKQILTKFRAWGKYCRAENGN
jgi:hypothetical protein